MRLRLALGKAPYQKWLIRCHLARRGVDLQFCILQTLRLATCGGYYAAYLQILYRGSWCKEAGDRRDACAMASMSAAAASFFAEASRADDGGAGDAGMTAKQAVVQARRRVLEALPAAGGDAEMPVARNWVAGSGAAPAAGQWIEDLAPATGQQVRFCGCWEVGATLADSFPRPLTVAVVARSYAHAE